MTTDTDPCAASRYLAHPQAASAPYTVSWWWHHTPLCMSQVVVFQFMPTSTRAPDTTWAAGSTEMKESDYQAQYRAFHAFTACEKKATHCVRGDQDVSACVAEQACFTTDGTNLFLCDDCLKFWRDCRRTDDRSTWETAVFLRRARMER